MKRIRISPLLSWVSFLLPIALGFDARLRVFYPISNPRAVAFPSSREGNLRFAYSIVVRWSTSTGLPMGLNFPDSTGLRVRVDDGP